MSLEIQKNGLLKESSQVRAPLLTTKNNVPFKAEPDTIVIHYTAGSSAESSARHLQNPDIRASAHVVIGKAGEIYQVVPFTHVAWHAGESAYGGRSNFNGFSIGIELDNPGPLEPAGTEFIAAFGRRYPASLAMRARHRNERVDRYWHVYTEEQIAACEELCRVLIKQYPAITQILGHEEISPGRKQDPGPAFPLDAFRNRILYNDRASDVDEAKPVFDKGVVVADVLNIRAGAGADFEKVAKPLSRNTPVQVLGERNGWYRVKVEVEGWVSKGFIDKRTGS